MKIELTNDEKAVLVGIKCLQGQFLKLSLLKQMLSGMRAFTSWLFTDEDYGSQDMIFCNDVVETYGEHPTLDGMPVWELYFTNRNGNSRNDDDVVFIDTVDVWYPKEMYGK